MLDQNASLIGYKKDTKHKWRETFSKRIEDADYSDSNENPKI